MELNVIAHIHNDYTEKFGIPRQSGLVESVSSRIVFCSQYRNPDALRGLEQYTHIWLIWQFSESVISDWQPTVRPPRLGGNKRMGVFATRSPFRPNPLGLSSVRIESIETDTPQGPVITVSGADLLNGTPIYDIKPYLPYVDCHADASDGFALNKRESVLSVEMPDEVTTVLSEEKLAALHDILAQDPRPQYQNDPERVYSMKFAEFDVSFTVADNTLVVTKIVSL